MEAIYSMTKLYVIALVLFALLHMPLASPEASPSNVFNPEASSTFSHSPDYTEFENDYQDGSSISGYTCEDIIQLGPASAKAMFGCADASESVGDWDFDGIVGLGLENSAMNNKPLFYSFCDAGSVDQCIFSVVLTDDGGEIQIGGYADDSVNSSTLVFTPVVFPCVTTHQKCNFKSVYTIQADHIRVENSSCSARDAARDLIMVNLSNIVTVVDSGVSCTLLPTDVTTTRGLNINFYEAIMKLRQTIATRVFVDISGQEFEIPLDGCFAPNPYNVLTLGDAFFRGKVVVHDLTLREQPRMGFAVLRAGYSPASGGPVRSARDVIAAHGPPHPHHKKMTTIRLWKKKKKKPNLVRIDTVGVSTYDENIYFTVLQAGTPRQSPFVVQIDTGSSFTAIFSQQNVHPLKKPWWEILLIAFAIVIPILSLLVCGLIYCGKKMRGLEEAQNNPGKV